MFSRLSRAALLASLASWHGAAEHKEIEWGTGTSFGCMYHDAMLRSSVTDECGHAGPDGPWNFVIWKVDGQTIPVYPTGGIISEIIYNSSYSLFSQLERYNQDTPQEEFANWSSWRNDTFVNDTKNVFDDYIRIPTGEKLGEQLDEDMQGNLTARLIDGWTTTLPDGTEYNQTVSIGGFGDIQGMWYPDDTDRTDDNGNPTAPRMPKSFISQFSEAADGSYTKSWSLSMGSAQHDQEGKFIFGGYDSNAIVGDVGVWPISPTQASFVWVNDIHLGVEEGDSPFNESGQISVWQGVGDFSDLPVYMSEEEGYPPVPAARVRLNPALPYMYLPPNQCKTLAEYLPVTYREDLGLYTWDTDASGRFERLVRSPAYLGFSFWESEDRNITVKVPFQVLNLTLEPPITDTLTPYFPCVELELPENLPRDTSRSELDFHREWQLGRAFLQAATVIESYETNTTFLAQAPGPGMISPRVRDIRADYRYADDLTPSSGPSFRESWESHWYPLDNDGSGGIRTGQADDSRSSGVSNETLIGAIVGSVGGAGLLVALVYFLCRLNRRTSRASRSKLSKKSNSPPDGSTATSSPSVDGGTKPELSNDNQRFEASAEEAKGELPFDNHSRRVEAPGEDGSRELDSAVVNEAPGSPAAIYEMDASRDAAPRSLLNSPSRPAPGGRARSL